FPILEFDDPVISHMRDRLRAKGYCPFQIRNAWEVDHSTVLQYMDANNLLPNTPGNHDNCTDVDCKIYQIPPDMTRCGCLQKWERCGPPVDEITRMIESGGVPLVHFESNTVGNIGSRLLVTRAEEDDEYIAFSHVWADGLGSVSEDGLFACQLSLL